METVLINLARMFLMFYLMSSVVSSNDKANSYLESQGLGIRAIYSFGRLITIGLGWIGATIMMVANFPSIVSIACIIFVAMDVYYALHTSKVYTFGPYWLKIIIIVLIIIFGGK